LGVGDDRIGLRHDAEIRCPDRANVRSDEFEFYHTRKHEKSAKILIISENAQLAPSLGENQISWDFDTAGAGFWGYAFVKDSNECLDAV
jgi:hypothetical protein